MYHREYQVYIMASTSGVLYVGITNNLPRRVWEHRNGTHDGFTKKYRCIHLVYYERYIDVREAIAREKELKKWRRQKKIELIQSSNPAWEDLGGALIDPSRSLP